MSQLCGWLQKMHLGKESNLLQLNITICIIAIVENWDNFVSLNLRIIIVFSDISHMQI